MANVSINLSAAAVAVYNQGADATAVGSLAEAIDLFFTFDLAFAAAHPTYTTNTVFGQTETFAYSGGSSTKFAGVNYVTQSPTLTTAFASSIENTVPENLRVTYTGRFDYQYGTLNNIANRLDVGAATITSGKLSTLLPLNSPNYNADLGNVALEYAGNVTVGDNGDFAGQLTELRTSADKFIKSSSIGGTINVSGNALTIANGSTGTLITGTATSYADLYHDGSQLSVTGAAMPLTGETAFELALLGQGANFPGADVFDVRLAAKMTAPLNLASGSGDDQLTLQSAGTAIKLDAGSGNDRITLLDHGMTINGGGNLDTIVLAGNRASFTVQKNGSAFSLSEKGGLVSDLLTNVERIKFADATMAIDINGAGGQAYRIYEAAFNRAPDSAGLGYWINVLDKGATLKEIAAGFVKSAEFASLYGASPSNTALVTALYTNVLNRAGEQAGINYWVSVLDSKAAPVSDVLMYFSEGAENQAATVGVIGNGFEYTPYIG